MSENSSEQLQSLKNQFDKGVDPSNKELTNDEKVNLSVDIAQQEFINNLYSTSGIEYLNKALNWPPSYEKTIKRQYPKVTLEREMVALATYELLESCSGGIFSPTESAAILVSDVGRFADKLEAKEDQSISEFGDILFARFSSATVALAGFKSEERRDKVFNDLQNTVSKVNEVFSLEVSGGHGQIDELVELFNKQKWSTQSILEGEPIHLVENLFRAYQGLTLREP